MKKIFGTIAVAALCVSAACAPVNNQPYAPAPTPITQRDWREAPRHRDDQPLSNGEIQRIQQLHNPQLIARTISPYPPHIADRSTMAAAEVYFYILQAGFIDRQCRMLDEGSKRELAGNTTIATQMMQARLMNAARPPLAPIDAERRVKALYGAAASEINDRRFYNCGPDAALVLKYGMFEAEEWQRTFARNARAYGY